MANLNFQQIEKLWTQEGGNPAWAPTMAAIAIGGESGGDPNARNHSGATGLFQILMSAQSAAFQKQWAGQNLNDPAVNTRIAVQMLGNGSGISNWEADSIGASIVANGSKPLTPQEAQQYAANPPAAGTVTPPASNVTAGTFKPVPAEAGVNVKNFHGYDLSAIPTQFVGEAEQAIQKYISDPNLRSKVEQSSGNAEYGYSSFALKIPQLNAVVITSALAPNGMWDENTFQGIVSNTQWYKQTTQNQRTWQAALVSDPASAHAALVQAQDQVLATANQVGVKLSAQQLNSIANTYAAQSYMPSNVLGAQSGTSKEWLEQAVVGAVTRIKNGQSDFSQTAPSDLTGVSGQLFNQFQNIAQSYLMYSPNGKGLLNDQQLQKYVSDALQNYTGSGSFGSSNLINGAVQSFTQQMMAQAKQMYPSMAQAIDAGTTPQSYVQPYQSLIGQTLGIDPTSINFTDPNWNGIIANPDPKTGVKTAMTLDQTLQKITDPNFSFTGPNGQRMTFDNTNTAMSNAHSIVNGLSQMFGIGGV